MIAPCLIGLGLLAAALLAWRWLIGAVEGGKVPIIGRLLRHKPRHGQFWKEGGSWVWREPPP